MTPKSSARKSPKEFSTPQAPTKVVERNLLGTSPLKEQFEPTEAMPMAQRQRMGGAG